MIKYLGSKRTLLPLILDAVRSIAGAATVVDLFSGTSRVGHALKGAGYRVLANDHNAYAATLARCYIEADLEDVGTQAAALIAELNGLPARGPGYFTETFCVRSRFIHPRNGERIDAIREAIARRSLPPGLEAVALVALMEAADRVDSTTGVQMAYLKDWAARAHKPLHLRVPDLLPRSPHGKGESHRLDASKAAGLLAGDVVYIDPPYNQHSYLGNYHVWESLVLWDKPEVYGVACKRVDVRDRTSVFNSRPRCAAALRTVLRRVRAPVVILSFSNEGFLSREELEAMLTEEYGGGTFRLVETAYPRYVGARIGIYNPQGEKVGRIGHLSNTEYLYIVRREAGSRRAGRTSRRAMTPAERSPGPC